VEETIFFVSRLIISLVSLLIFATGARPVLVDVAVSDGVEEVSGKRQEQKGQAGVFTTGERRLEFGSVRGKQPRSPIVCSFTKEPAEQLKATFHAPGNSKICDANDGGFGYRRIS
jgi:hypothetical protein